MSERPNQYIIIAQQDWSHNLGSNARNLAVELSKHGPVMYVNPPLDIKTALANVGKFSIDEKLRIALGANEDTSRITGDLWVHTPSYINLSINWIKNEKLYDSFNRRNAKSFFKSLKKSIQGLGWSWHSTIVINDSQMFIGQYLKDFCQPSLSFYYVRDNLVEHPYFKYHGTRIEPQTIKRADAVIANSSYLANYARKFNDLSFDVGQGCELSIYDSKIIRDIPSDLAKIPSPTIGYIGLLTGERLDIPLLEELANKEQSWNWVFIGPQDEQFRVSKLHEFSNVYFLGPKPAELLPAYLQHLDVCINPQSLNPLTVGNYPRKIDEYLAMGKPVVATNTPAMEMFAPYVHLASGVNDYHKAIQVALSGIEPELASAAISFAQGHTWEACVEKILHIKKSIEA